MIDIVALPDAPHQMTAAQALMAGLKRHDVACRMLDRTEQASADIVACWGWRNGLRHAQRGACVLVMERGYAGDRMAWTSLGWNGLNGRAEFPAVDDGGRRWRRHFGGLMKRARRHAPAGGYTLVLGQVRGDMSLAGTDILKFYSEAARRLRGPVRFRPHPVEMRRYGQPSGGLLHGMELVGGTLAEALSGAACAVAWNSNALTDAVLAGVPAIACDRGAMAWPVAGRGLEAAPKIGDRRPWAHRLAWCQWSLDEMRSGEAWEAVGGDVAPWN